MPREGGGDGRAVDALAGAHRAAEALEVPLEELPVADGAVGAVAATRPGSSGALLVRRQNHHPSSISAPSFCTRAVALSPE